MLKHVFYDLAYATTIFNMIKKWLKMSWATNNQLMIHDNNLNKIVIIDWSKNFIMPKRVFYDLSYAIIMSVTIKEMIKNVFSN